LGRNAETHVSTPPKEVQAVLVADPDRRYVDANDAAQRLLGYALDELLSLSVDDVVLGAGQSVATEDDHWSGMLTVRRADGSEVAVEAEAIAVAGPDGPLVVSWLHEAATPAHSA
jgi:PAS domain S-box-containing protein